jgi:hypothetical protein
MKSSASAVELGFEDDFSDSRDSVFVNSFSVTSSLCAQKMSASAVDLGFRYDFWYSWVSRMIFRTAATLFSSTVSQSAVVYVRKKHHCQLLNLDSWMIFASQGPSSRQRFMRQQ